MSEDAYSLEQKTDLVLVRRLERPRADTQFVLGADFIVGPYLVPKGFQTDLASVPRAVRSLVSKVDGIEASVVHDYLYHTRMVSRDEADRVFLDLLADAVPAWKRWSMFWAVRAFGGPIYDT